MPAAAANKKVIPPIADPLLAHLLIPLQGSLPPSISLYQQQRRRRILQAFCGHFPPAFTADETPRPCIQDTVGPSLIFYRGVGISGVGDRIKRLPSPSRPLLSGVSMLRMEQTHAESPSHFRQA